MLQVTNVPCKSSRFLDAGSTASAAIPQWLFSVALGDRNNPVHTGDGNVLYLTIWPVDFYVVNLSGLPEAEMEARVAG